MNKVVIRGHGASAISDLFSPAAAGYSDRTASVGAITFIPDFALGSSCQT
jgi:hypothetical protein